MHTLEYLTALFARRLELSGSQKLADDFRALMRAAEKYDPEREQDDDAIRALYKEWCERYGHIMYRQEP